MFYLHPNHYSVPRIVLNSLQFNSSVMLLNSQLVCLQPDGILTVILLKTNES